MGSRRTGTGTIPLDKNYLFLNTKGLCLLCYEECPPQTQEKRRATTQTSVNFTRLISRYLGFNIDNVIVAPLKKVGRKCVIQKEQQNAKKIDKVGYELCDRCASLAHAFCQVQFQMQFHQMILDRCVRSISEIIKDANKKSAAELFTLSGDDEAMGKQQKTFTRLTSGGLKSAYMLRKQLHNKSLHKLSKSFPILKMKRICKSGDWIPFLNKQDNKDVSKNVPMDSTDVIFASLLGCVVSLWIVLSLSFINPDEYALRMIDEKSKPKKKLLPVPIVNCDELELEIKFPAKKKPLPQGGVVLSPHKPQRRASRSLSSTSSNAQTPQPPSKLKPVVIHKHPNQIVQISKTAIVGSHCHPGHGGITNSQGEVGAQSDPASFWKPKSTKYPTSLQPIPITQHPPPPRAPVVHPLSSSSVQPTIPHSHHYPPQSQQYSMPPSPTTLSSVSLPSSSNYNSYPPTNSSVMPPPHLTNAHPLSSTSHDYPHYTTMNSNDDANSSFASNYNYSYNFTTYNYNPSSTWPSGNTAAMEPVPPSAYSPQTNGEYNPYSANASHGSSRVDIGNSSDYDYGYDYNNYAYPNQSIPNNYPHQNAPNQYATQSAGPIYAEPTGSGYNDAEPTSYTTLLPPTSSSRSFVAHGTNVVIPMDVDTTNTSTSDEPSLTHEDPQSLDSESASMNGDDQKMYSVDNETGSGGLQSPQFTFPENHWRQQQGTSPPVSCKKSGCTEQFITQGQLQIHLLTHGDFQCSFCHLTFSKAHNLAHHEKMRHGKNVGIGKNKCPRCNFTSSSQYKYFLHFLTHHLNIPLFDKPCTVCNKQFILGTKMINRKNHFKFYHDVEGKDPSTIFTCKGCDAPFLKEAQLRDHQPNCTAIASISSSTSSVEEITYNTALATAEQIVM